MDGKKYRLIQKARNMYGQIFPCANKSSLEECFATSHNGDLILWFNTKDNSTHMVADGDVAVYDVLTLENSKKKKRD